MNSNIEENLYVEVRELQFALVHAQKILQQTQKNYKTVMKVLVEQQQFLFDRKIQKGLICEVYGEGWRKPLDKQAAIKINSEQFVFSFLNSSPDLSILHHAITEIRLCLFKLPIIIYLLLFRTITLNICEENHLLTEANGVLIQTHIHNLFSTKSKVHTCRKEFKELLKRCQADLFDPTEPKLTGLSYEFFSSFFSQYSGLCPDDYEERLHLLGSAIAKMFFAGHLIGHCVPFYYLNDDPAADRKVVTLPSQSMIVNELRRLHQRGTLN